MKWLFLNWRDLKNPRGGGAEVVTEAICAELSKRGHEVTLFTAAFPGSKAEETVNGFKIIRAGGPLTCRLAARRWWKQFGQHEGFEVVIDQFHGLPFFTPWYIPKHKILAFIHEVPRSLWFLIAKFPASLFFYLVEPMIFWPYRQIKFLTVSGSTKADLVRRGIPARQIAIIPESIDAKPLSSLPAKAPVPKLIFVGRHHPMKRLPHLIKMMALLPKEYTLDLVGRGDAQYIEELKELAGHEGVRERVSFLGAVPLEEKTRLMREAGLMVAASRKEGWGLIVTEANALGTPAVTYNVAGYRDSVRAENSGAPAEQGSVGYLTGWLAKENTPAGLAQAVQAALNNPAEYQKRRQAAWEDSRQYRDERTVDAVLQAVGQK